MQGKMKRQVTYLARHYSIANNVSGETLLVLACHQGDHGLLLKAYLASGDKLSAAYVVGMARPAIFVDFRPHNINECHVQMLKEEGVIDDGTGDNRDTGLSGCPDDIMLLSSMHIRCPSSGGRDTPRQNLVSTRVLSMAVGTGAFPTSSNGGGALPTLPCGDAILMLLGGILLVCFVRQKKALQYVLLLLGIC
jgi:hypothetical protein